MLIYLLYFSALQILHIHALEGLQAILGGLELGCQAFFLCLDSTDAPAVLVQNGIDDLLGQRLVAHLDVLQEFAFHGCSFLRFALISRVASPAVGVFAPATDKIGMKKRPFGRFIIGIEFFKVF